MSARQATSFLPMKMSTFEQLNGVREHPDFGIRQIRGNSGNSNYHAMQLRVERRFAKTLSFTGSYTWSRMIDSTSEIYAGIADRLDW